MARDKRYIELINSRRWRELRRRVLTEEPLCRRCREAGRLTSAVEVHHRRPVQSGADAGEMRLLAYDRLNLVPLCTDCHQRVHIEMKSKGNAEHRKRRQREETEDFCRRWFGMEPGEGDRGGVFLNGEGGA